MTCQLADLTMELLPRCSNADRPKAELMARIWGLWRQPLHNHIDPLLVCYKQLFDVGNNMWAGISGVCYVHFYFHAGNLPLGFLIGDAISISKFNHQKNHDPVVCYLTPTVQLIVNLNSRDGDSATLKILQGDFVTDPAKHNGFATSKLLSLFQTYQHQRLQLALHFQDIDLCEQISEIYWTGPKHPDGTLFTGFARRFHYAFAAYCIAPTNRKYLKRGIKMQKELGYFAKNGNVNVVHLLLILVAIRKRPITGPS